jgi:hypothetical protein
MTTAPAATGEREMKRWNHKGSAAAKVRMAELRARKRQLHKDDLARAWEAKHPGEHWWPTSGLHNGCGVEASIAWLERALADCPHS